MNRYSDQDMYMCKTCCAISISSELLRAESPFCPGDTITACPRCHATNHFAMVCDEPTCDTVACVGWPSADGYRHTCAEHEQEIGK